MGYMDFGPGLWIQYEERDETNPASQIPVQMMKETLPFLWD